MPAKTTRARLATVVILLCILGIVIASPGVLSLSGPPFGDLFSGSVPSRANPSGGPGPQDDGGFAPFGHFGGYIASIAVPPSGGSPIFVGTGAGLTAVDVSAAAAPQPVGSLSFPGTDVTDVVFVGTTAVLIDGGGLNTVDVSDPARPALLGRMELPGEAYGLDVVGTTAYVTLAPTDGDVWLYTYDLSLLSAPTPLGSLDVPGGGYDIDVAGTLACVADGNSGLTLVDVGDPAHPAVIVSHDLDGVALDVEVSGATAYVAAGDFFGEYTNGLIVVDVSTPSAPVTRGTWDGESTIVGLAMSGTTAYLAGGQAGLAIVDASNPAAPVLAGTYTGDWAVDCVAVDGTTLYVGDGAQGLVLLDVSAPASPTLLGSYTWPTEIANVWIPDMPAVAGRRGVSGTVGFMVSPTRFWSVDMANPAAPDVVGSCALQPRDWDDWEMEAVQIMVVGSYAYVAEQDYGLEIVDVSDPSNPTVVGRWARPEGASVNDVVVSGATAFVPLSQDGDGKLYVLDVSDPGAIELVTAYDTPGDARRIALEGTIGYLADGAAGLRILDLATPASPTELGSSPIPGAGATADVVAVGDGFVFLGSNAEGQWWIQRLDATEPASPSVEAQTVQTQGTLRDLTVDDACIYAAVDGASLVVFDFVGITVRAWISSTNSVAVFRFQRGNLVIIVIIRFSYGVGQVYQNGDPETTPTTTRTASGTPTPSRTATPTRTATETEAYITPTDTPTVTPTHTPTLHRTPTPTLTPEASWVKTASVTEVLPGETIHYRVVLTWKSPYDLPAPSNLVDRLPDYCQYVSGNATPGTVTFDGTHIRWQGTIESGSSAIINYYLRVKTEELMKIPVDQWPTEIVNHAAGTIEQIGWSATRSVALLPPDLTITGIEVTQGIQDLDYGVRSIKQKETYVRVYIKAAYPDDKAGPDVPDVPVKLTGPGGDTLDPINEKITARVLAGQDRPTVDERNTLTKSLYFRLPRPWRSQASYKLKAEVNPNEDRPDSNLENNEEEVDLEFVDTQRIYVYLYPVEYTHGGAELEPVDAAFKSIAKRLHVMPVADENRRVRYRSSFEWNADMTRDAGDDALIEKMWELRHKRSRWPSDFSYDYAILHQDVDTSRTIRVDGVDIRGTVQGCTQMNEFYGYVKMDRSVETTAIVLTHELGHNLGRRHVDCPAGDVPGLDANWPAAIPSCQLSAAGSRDAWGFDTRRPWVNVRNPTQWADVMSYGDKRWMSAHSWEGYYLRLKTGAAATASLDAHERLGVTGWISPTGTAGGLNLVRHFDHVASVPVEIPGPYTLELQNGAGQVLDDVSFDVVTDGRGEETNMWFGQTLAYDAAGTRLVLKERDTVLAEREASDHAPTVAVTSPTGGETITDTLTVAWTADDADGDALSYAVSYSVDNGDSWVALDVQLTETTLVYDAAELPGGDQCLVRVAAHDGFHTTYAVCGAPLIASRKPPTVIMLEPDDGSQYGRAEWLVLRGQGYDQDDADLPGANLAWSSDRDGALGTGEELTVAGLSIGEHTITLTGTDGEGLTASESVDIFVGYRASLPIVVDVQP